MSVNEKMTAIADAIREKTGDTQKLTLDQMAAGVSCVYDAGKQAQEDAFWDTLQRNGTRNDYQYAFLQWDAEEIRPKYILTQPRLYATFTQNARLKRVTESTLDLNAGATNMYSTFAWCAALEEVDVHILLAENADAVAMMATFNNCTALKRIKKITSVAHVQYSKTFNQCTALESVTFEGVIGNNISFENSPLLNKASIVSIINALSDSTSGLSITFSLEAVDNAFYDPDGEAAPGADSLEWNLLIAKKENWTISLV